MDDEMDDATMSMEPDNDNATQSTQTVDPRRTARNTSAMSNVADIADVICILHPCSPTAFEIVQRTAARAPQHVLQIGAFNDSEFELSQAVPEEQDTFILGSQSEQDPCDLALRFSSKTVNPAVGFVFGRNSGLCDIIFDTDKVKHLSNMHFRIFVNRSGVCMLHDMSTNGTMVDGVLLKGKGMATPQTRMLDAGSIIQILSPRKAELVKFIFRLPTRHGHMEEYTDRFQSYMQGVSLAEAQLKINQEGIVKPLLPQATRPLQDRATATGGVAQTPFVSKQWGMHWDGGEKYNVAGHLGKGAFATVFMLATRRDGQYYAAKELEKRRFMKNGILDRKLDNELQIMKNISHQNIVQYVESFDHDKYLYIIMEYVPCGDLQQYLSAKGALPEALAKTIAAQVLQALTYLHSKRITHRDIKPDNILIAYNDPSKFHIKLSDFGLSKVVKDNETFLKTFCGTLLYCAPEVFPHYDAHAASKGRKRNRHGGSTTQQSTYHSYSQSVDIWSFGAVLWFALCLRPPFEGVLDQTGRGMFERIMSTALDIRPLCERGVSEEGIELLMAMLNTDPSERPTSAQCLRSLWFLELDITQDADESDHTGLITIAEEGEAQPDMSQLSMQENYLEQPDIDHADEISFNSADLEFLDPRQSKRFKTARHPYREQEDYDCGSDYPGKPRAGALRDVAETNEDPHSLAKRPFDGTPHTAFRSSGVLGELVNDELPTNRHSTDHVSHPHSETAGKPQHQHSACAGQEQQIPSYVSTNVTDPQGLAHRSSGLLGADSEMRNLKMESPESASSPAVELNEPVTPKTPEQQSSSHGQADGNAEETPTKPCEITPKPATFSRQIELPIRASYFWDPHDESTHTLEYSSEVSGHDFTTNPILPEKSLAAASFRQSMKFGALPQKVSTTSDMRSINVPSLEPAADFIRPLPRVGRLTSTPDSFTSINIHLSSRVFTWGRGPNNTVVYPDKLETKVPKRGITLIFHADGISQVEQAGKDWTKLPGLQCFLSTESSVGISVNGVKLPATNKEKRRLCGKVYTGDVITVWPSRSHDKGLKFVCVFFHGKSKEGRPQNAARFEVQESNTGKYSSMTA